MKKFKKIMAVLVAAIMVVAMTVPAFAAVTISVSRDDSGQYEGLADDDSRVLKYYKVFSATSETGFEGNEDESGTWSTATGAALELEGDDSKGVAYTASGTVGDKLGNLTGTDRTTWAAKTENKWFELQWVPARSLYNVRLKAHSMDTAKDIQDAALYLYNNGIYEGSGTALVWNSSTHKWEATVDEGYYIIDSDAGKNLIAATTNIQVREKNGYPTITKSQKDEDVSDFTTSKVNARIGEVITYRIPVTIPMSAKVGDRILVYDDASNGVTFNSDVSAKIGTSAGTGDPASSGQVRDVTEADETAALVGTHTWAKVIVVDSSMPGKVVTFTCTMTADTDILTDTDRKNEVALKYGRETFVYTAVPKEVLFTTHFTGIKKVDSVNESIELANVEFTLKEGDAEFTVKKDGDFYYPATGTGASSTVVTDSDGNIKIRGLNGDRSYTLTETLPNNGYYTLKDPIPLTLYEDKVANYVQCSAGSWDAGTTYYTYDGSAYTAATSLTETLFDANPTNYYTKDSNSGLYDTMDIEDTWIKVPNEKGTILPATGGMGTTVLYIVGGMLVILAGAYLFFSRKRTA